VCIGRRVWTEAAATVVGPPRNGSLEVFTRSLYRVSSFIRDHGLHELYGGDSAERLNRSSTKQF
jgi:hypothetical protein